jgi:dihydroorotase
MQSLMLPHSINTHLHCRDEGDSYKTTILEQMNIAKSYGRVAVIDMPNNNPRTLSMADIERRNAIAERNGCLKGYYINIGGTNDKRQLAEAVEAVDKYENVAGIKIFTTGPDSDPIVVKYDKDQESFHKNLKDLSYTGILIPHCEDESLFRIGSFDPSRPGSWNIQRPKEAETSAIKKMIAGARKVDADYHIHFPHVTCSESIDEIAKNTDYVSMSFEVTPQSLLKSTRDMVAPESIDLKMNPPIRSQETVDLLWERLQEIVLRGRIHVTSGTDQAVHTPKEKSEGSVSPDGKISGYLSGVQGEKMYPEFVQELRLHEFSPMEINQIVYRNAKNVFRKIKE